MIFIFLLSLVILSSLLLASKIHKTLWKNMLTHASTHTTRTSLTIVKEGFAETAAPMQSEWSCYPVELDGKVKYAIGRKNLNGEVECASTAPTITNTTKPVSCPVCKPAPKCPKPAPCPKLEPAPARPSMIAPVYENNLPVVMEAVQGKLTNFEALDAEAARLKKEQDDAKAKLDALQRGLEVPGQTVSLPPEQLREQAQLEAEIQEQQMTEQQAADAAAADVEDPNVLAGAEVQAPADPSNPGEVDTTRQQQMEQAALRVEQFVDISPESCMLFDSLSECRLSKNNMTMIHPYTCKNTDVTKANTTCNSLQPQIWQCLHDTVNDMYAPIRRNIKGEMECMGYTEDGCAWTSDVHTCNAQIQTISNQDHLNCGEKYKQFFGTDPYQSPTHWCSQFKNIV